MEKEWEGHEYSTPFQEGCILEAKTSGKEKTSLTVPAHPKVSALLVPPTS